MTDSYSGSGRRELAERLLTHLRGESGDDRIRELADDVLSGRATLADAVAAAPYADALEPSLSGFVTWLDGIDPDELTRHVEQSRVEILKLNDGSQAERGAGPQDLGASGHSGPSR